MDWNHRYQIRDTPWDKGLATPVLEEIHGRHPEFPRGSVLVPGCGAGHDARWLAARGCRVTGLDIAPLAIDEAKTLDPDGTVSFRTGDFLNPSEIHPDNFDLLWEHTCFCAIDPAHRAAYVESAFRVLRPGGGLTGVFFTNPEMDEGESGPPFGIDVAELIALFQKKGFGLRDSWVPVTGYPGRVGRELAALFVKPA